MPPTQIIILCLNFSSFGIFLIDWLQWFPYSFCLYFYLQNSTRVDGEEETKDSHLTKTFMEDRVCFQYLSEFANEAVPSIDRFFAHPSWIHKAIDAERIFNKVQHWVLTNTVKESSNRKEVSYSDWEYIILLACYWKLLRLGIRQGLWLSPFLLNLTVEFGTTGIASQHSGHSRRSKGWLEGEVPLEFCKISFLMCLWVFSLWKFFELHSYDLCIFPYENYTSIKYWLK